MARSKLAGRSAGAGACAVAAAVAATLAYWAWVQFLFWGDAATAAVANIGQLVAPLIAAAACASAAAAAQDRASRRAWLLLGGAASSWAGGQAIWTYDEVLRGTTTPFPSIADLGFLASVPLAVAGLLTFQRVAVSGLARFQTMLDGALIGVSLLFVSWAAGLETLVSESEGTLAEQVLGLAYPVGDVVMLTVALVAFTRAQRKDAGTFALVAGGVAALGIADSLFLFHGALDGSATGPLADTAWFASWLLLALGARRGRRDPVAGTRPTEQVPDVARSASVYLPFLGLLVAAVARTSTGAPLDVTITAMGATAGLLLVLSQTLAQIQITRLARSLADSASHFEHRSLHDPLTGLPNRILFEDRLEVALHHSGRNSAGVAVLFCDLDNFKAVNDHHGHDVGDDLLVEVARQLEAHLRPADTVARLSGDEFVVLCDDVEAPGIAMTLANRLSSAVHHALDGAFDVPVSTSIGVAFTRDGDMPPEELIAQADAAMYLAKRLGRDRIELYRPGVEELAASAEVVRLLRRGETAPDSLRVPAMMRPSA